MKAGDSQRWCPSAAAQGGVETRIPLCPPPTPTPPDPLDPACCRPGGARLRTHRPSASPSQLATEKLRTCELWGNGLLAQTKSESPRGNRPVYNSDILI